MKTIPQTICLETCQLYPARPLFYSLLVCQLESRHANLYSKTKVVWACFKINIQMNDFGSDEDDEGPVKGANDTMECLEESIGGLCMKAEA